MTKGDTWQGTLAEAVARVREIAAVIRNRPNPFGQIMPIPTDARAIERVLDAVTDPHARVSAHPKSPSEPPPERPAALTPCDAGVSSPLHASQGAILGEAA